MTAPHLFCFGLGYTATVLARRLTGSGWVVGGTCRAAEKAATLREEGFRAQLFDHGRPLSKGAFAGPTHLLVSVPPDATGDPVLATHGNDIPAGLSWVGYLSTTGVYGDRGGGWVDETAARCRPESAAAAGSRPKQAGSTSGAAAGCRFTSSGSPAFTVRAAAPSTHCGPARRGGSTSQGRFSPASMSRIWRLC